MSISLFIAILCFSLLLIGIFMSDVEKVKYKRKTDKLEREVIALKNKMESKDSIETED